jgi:hypothetical protein
MSASFQVTLTAIRGKILASPPVSAPLHALIPSPAASSSTAASQVSGLSEGSNSLFPLTLPGVAPAAANNASPALRLSLPALPEVRCSFLLVAHLLSVSVTIGGVWCYHVYTDGCFIDEYAQVRRCSSRAVRAFHLYLSIFQFLCIPFRRPRCRPQILGQGSVRSGV